jgi:hypothetical protein
MPGLGAAALARRWFPEISWSPRGGGALAAWPPAARFMKVSPAAPPDRRQPLRLRPWPGQAMDGGPLSCDREPVT